MYIYKIYQFLQINKDTFAYHHHDIRKSRHCLYVYNNYDHNH